MHFSKTIILATIALMAAGLFAGCGGNPAADETVTFTVISKERGSGHGENKQPTLVWGKLDNGKKETFKLEDSLWESDMSSGDTYGMLVPDKTFTCKANGYRSQWFSEYRNLTNCDPA